MKTIFGILAWFALVTWNTHAGAEGGYRPSGSAAVETTWIFAPHPNLNPQDLFNAYTPLVRYLEHKIPGARFTIESSRDYADYEAKIAARRFHFGLPNPYQTVLGFAHGYRVIAKMTPDEDFRGLMLVRRDSKLRTPADLAGKTLCFISPSAVAATMLPLMYLHEHGVNVKENTLKYVGSPFSALAHAHSGEVPACGVSSRQWRAWSRENPAKSAEMTALFTTRHLPSNSIVARDDVPPALARQVAEALAGMDRDGELDQSQFKFDQNHYELATNATYQPFIDFLARYDGAIGLPPQMKLNPRP